MKLVPLLLLLAQSAICQIEPSVTSSEIPSIIDTGSPAATNSIVTPTLPVILPTDSSTPVIDILSSVSITSDLLTSTLITSTITTTGSSSTTNTASVNATASDDDAEITTTGTIQAEPTGELEVPAPANEIPRELTADESVALTALELETYADLLVNTPLPKFADDPPEANVVALPACPVSAASLAKRSILGDLVKPKPAPKKPVFYPCMPSSLFIEVVYHYVPANKKVNMTRNAELRTQVAKQHAHFAKVMEIYGINLVRNEVTELFRTPTPRAARFTNHFYSIVDSEEGRTTQADYANYRRATRVGGDETLNVWIVDLVRNEKGLSTMYGYAQFPEDKKFKMDGIVIKIANIRSSNDAEAARLPSRRGSYLIHEFGHWMGLRHTFGDSDCGKDDGFKDTWQTSEVRPAIFDEAQSVCGRPELEDKWIYYYMSYSKAIGTYKGNLASSNLKSFTPMQHAAMFARFSAFRSGVIYNGKFCNQKRSLFPDHVLQRRAEDKAKLLADLLLNNCSVAIQDVYQEDTIPLPKSLLVSYSSAASVLAANPTSNTNPYAPRTATIGTGVAAEATSDGSATGGASPGETGKPSSGNNLKSGGVVAFLGSAICGLALGMMFL